jgi:hypothetical protein
LPLFAERRKFFLGSGENLDDDKSPLHWPMSLDESQPIFVLGGGGPKLRKLNDLHRLQSY